LPKPALPTWQGRNSKREPEAGNIRSNPSYGGIACPLPSGQDGLCLLADFEQMGKEEVR